MNRVAPYFFIFVLPLLTLLGVELRGWWLAAPIVLVFALIPLLDSVLRLETRNPPEERGHQARFDLPVLAWVPVQLGTLGFALWRVSTVDFSGLETVAVALSLGLMSAGGINVAHELMHRKGRLHRACAEALMTSVTYTHFCVEHVLGHHRRVATEADAASSRLGESFYRFYPRVVLGSLVSAWGLERDRCAKRGIRWTSLRDRRTRYALVLALVYVGIGLAWGPLGLGVFALQSAVAFTLLEAINYIEHYGLSRSQLASGRFERVMPEHSWNSAHRISNLYLFNLARHSDHHYLASREYDRLRHYEDVPQLPGGYPAMVLLGLVPPLWFRVMDPRVAAWNRRETTGETTGESHRAAA